MFFKQSEKKEKLDMNALRKSKLKYFILIPGIILMLYAAGFIGALINPSTATGMNFGFLPSLQRAFTTKAGWNGIVIMILIVGALFLYIKIQGKLNGDTDDRNVKHSENGTYGTSWFMDEKELAETFKLTSYAAETDGIILGTSIDSGKVVSIPIERGKNRNIAIAGAQGSQKSVAFSRNMIMQAAARGASIFCTDPKSELTEDMYYYLKEEGYDVYVWNLIDMINSDSWDILAEIEDGKYMDVLCDVIIKNTLNGDDPDHFYDGIEKNLLKALCYYVYTVKPAGKRTLAEAYNMLITYKADELDKIFDDLRATDPENPAIGPYMLFAKAPNSKGNAILGLGTRLQIFQNPLVKRITSTPDIDLTAMAKRKTAIFCITSDQDSTYDVLASTLVCMTFIKTVRYADSRPDRMCDVPIEFILDEMPSIGEIPDFQKKLATARSRDIGITMIFQNLPQMQERYPRTNWENLLSGCDYRIMLGCNDTTTSNYYSELTGLATIEVSTERKTLNSIRMTDYTPQYAESKGEGQRPVMFEDEVRRMDDTELLLIMRGKKPVRLKKFGYFNHTESLKLRQVKTSEIIPPWRVYQGEDILTNEKIESPEDLLERVGNDDTRLVVKNSEKYGPQRALLERDVAEVKKRYKKQIVPNEAKRKLNLLDKKIIKNEEKKESNPDNIDSNLQSVISGHIPSMSEDVKIEEKMPQILEQETVAEKTQKVMAEMETSEPLKADPNNISDIDSETNAASLNKEPEQKKTHDSETESLMEAHVIEQDIPIRPEHFIKDTSIEMPVSVKKDSEKKVSQQQKVHERKSNLSQLKNRDDLKTDDYLNLLKKNKH